MERSSQQLRELSEFSAQWLWKVLSVTCKPQQLSNLQNTDYTNFHYPQPWGFSAGAFCSNTRVFNEIPAKESFFPLVSHIYKNLFETSAAYATSALETGEIVQNWRIMPFPRPEWRYTVMVWGMIVGFRLQYEKIGLKPQHPLPTRENTPSRIFFFPGRKNTRSFLI